MPQFFFDGTYYLPYVRKKPSAEALITHPLRLIWYDLQRSDFIVDHESLLPDTGLIRQDLADEFVRIRKELSAKVKELVEEREWSAITYQEMLHSERAMHFAALTLTFAPQNWLYTLSTVTLFQRQYLETLAVYEYLTIWKPRLDQPLGEEARPVDDSIMGALTCDPMIAEQFYDQGVPIWLVRHSSQVKRSLLLRDVPPTPFTDPMVSAKFPALHAIYSGPPSSQRHRACQSLRISGIRIGHMAYGIELGNAGPRELN